MGDETYPTKLKIEKRITAQQLNGLLPQALNPRRSPAWLLFD